MTKRTKKVGIVGKYGTRYGGALRKILKKFELQQHAKYVCPHCGKVIYSSFRHLSEDKLSVSGSVMDARLSSLEEPMNSAQQLPPLPRSQ
jgi:hypothetical protein